MRCRGRRRGGSGKRPAKRRGAAARAPSVRGARPRPARQQPVRRRARWLQGPPFLRDGQRTRFRLGALTFGFLARGGVSALQLPVPRASCDWILPSARCARARSSACDAAALLARGAIGLAPSRRAPRPWRAPGLLRARLLADLPLAGLRQRRTRFRFRAKLRASRARALGCIRRCRASSVSSCASAARAGLARGLRLRGACGFRLRSAFSREHCGFRFRRCALGWPSASGAFALLASTRDFQRFRVARGTCLGRGEKFALGGFVAARCLDRGALGLFALFVRLRRLALGTRTRLRFGGRGLLSFLAFAREGGGARVGLRAFRGLGAGGAFRFGTGLRGRLRCAPRPSREIARPAIARRRQPRGAWLRQRQPCRLASGPVRRPRGRDPARRVAQPRGPRPPPCGRDFPSAGRHRALPGHASRRRPAGRAPILREREARRRASASAAARSRACRRDLLVGRRLPAPLLRAQRFRPRGVPSPRARTSSRRRCAPRSTFCCALFRRDALAHLLRRMALRGGALGGAGIRLRVRPAHAPRLRVVPPHFRRQARGPWRWRGVRFRTFASDRGGALLSLDTSALGALRLLLSGLPCVAASRACASDSARAFALAASVDSWAMRAAAASVARVSAATSVLARSASSRSAFARSCAARAAALSATAASWAIFSALRVASSGRG